MRLAGDARGRRLACQRPAEAHGERFDRERQQHAVVKRRIGVHGQYRLIGQVLACVRDEPVLAIVTTRSRVSVRP